MFRTDRIAIGAIEVATELGVARSTAYRYLQSLVKAQYLEESAQGFRLGQRILELASIARVGFGLSEIARSVMRNLALEVRETVLLTRLAGSSVICLEREEAIHQTVRISYERGQLLPTNAGASAYVLLAWLTESELADVLADVQFERFTNSTLTTKDALIDRLKATRSAGYAVSLSELDDNVLGVAAPIRNGSGRVVAAISVAAVATRVPTERVAMVADVVRAAAQTISASLGLYE
jgi:DNA-binding IclR family transcriptional regulator